MLLCWPSPDRGEEHGKVNKATLVNQIINYVRIAF